MHTCHTIWLEEKTEEKPKTKKIKTLRKAKTQKMKVTWSHQDLWTVTKDLWSVDSRVWKPVYVYAMYLEGAC